MISMLADTDPIFDPANGVADIAVHLFTTTTTHIAHFATPLLLIGASIHLAYLFMCGRGTLFSVLKTSAGTAMAIGMLNLLPNLLPPTADPSKPNTKPAPPAPAPNHTGPAESFDWSVLAVIAGVTVAIAAVIGLAYASTHLLQLRSRRRADAANVRAAQLQRWETGQQAMRTISMLLMNFENDPEAVYFTRPLLADVNEPATAAFYTAFTNARALNLETAPTDDKQISAFVVAATVALQAFTTADDNARRKARLGVIHGDRTLTKPEAHKLDQARKLLAHALDPANTPELATQAHTKAQKLLDEVGLIIPERLTATTVRSIEALHQIALPATPAVTS